MNLQWGFPRVPVKAPQVAGGHVDFGPTEGDSGDPPFEGASLWRSPPSGFGVSEYTLSDETEGR